MKKISKYSVIGTEYETLKRDGEDIIEKSVISNIDLGLSQDQLFSYFDQYIKEIQEAGINLPEIKSHKVLDDRITFQCKNAGTNILEIYELNELVKGEGKQYLKLALKEIIKAIDSNINLDPHIKNFVIGSEELFYVDFSPPYTKQFIEMRIEKSDLTEVDLIRENFQNFSPENLLHHFLGDFFNVDRKIPNEIIEGIYTVINEVSPQDLGMNEFLMKSKRIRASEDERIKRKIYLY